MALIDDILATSQGVGDTVTSLILQGKQRKRKKDEALSAFERQAALRRELLQSKIDAESQRSDLDFEREKELVGLKQGSPLNQARTERELAGAESNRELAAKRRLEQKKIQADISKVNKEIKGLGKKASGKKVSDLNFVLDDMERRANSIINGDPAKGVPPAADDDPRRLVANKMLSQVTNLRTRLSRKLGKEIGLGGSKPKDVKSMSTSELLKELAKGAGKR